MDITYNYPSNQNSGQISQTVDAISGETVTYQYDALRRLANASSNQSWTEAYTYDGHSAADPVNAYDPTGLEDVAPTDIFGLGFGPGVDLGFGTLVDGIGGGPASNVDTAATAGTGIPEDPFTWSVTGADKMPTDPSVMPDPATTSSSDNSISDIFSAADPGLMAVFLQGYPTPQKIIDLSLPSVTLFVCKSSPERRTFASMKFGALKGLVTGAAFGAAGGFLEAGIGLIPGEVIGGILGGMAGAEGGVFNGAATAALCSFAGAYGPPALRPPSIRPPSVRFPRRVLKVH